MFATMRDPSRSKDLLRTADAAGVSVRVLELDVDDDASVSAAFEEAGPVDVLVNNAGVSPMGSVEEFPIAAWKALFETNLFGAVRCMQAALPGMREHNTGHIINVSTAGASGTLPVFGAYSASKRALEVVSEALAAEAAIFGVGVSIVIVGAVVTPIREKAVAPPATSPYRPVRRNAGLPVSRKWSMKNPHLTRPSPRVLPNMPSKGSVNHWAATITDMAHSHTGRSPANHPKAMVPASPDRVCSSPRSAPGVGWRRLLGCGPGTKHGGSTHGSTGRQGRPHHRRR